MTVFFGNLKFCIMSGDKQHICTKAKQIDKIEGILHGNGKKGVLTLISDSFNHIENLTKSMHEMRADVKVLLQFQTQVEVKQQQEAKFEKKMENVKAGEMVNKRWRIGLMISTVLGLFAIVVSLMAMTYGEPKKRQSEGVTDEEFQKLWEQYKENHNIRGLVVFEDSIN